MNINEARVRDHLANERTALAWVRTSIALMGFGVVIARLRFDVIAVPAAQVVNPHAGVRSTLLGLTFVAVGLLTLISAAAHYEHTRRRIEAGDYRASPAVMLAFVAVIFVLGLACVAYLLTLWPA